MITFLRRELTPPVQNRFRDLDGLRAVAILLVVLFHVAEVGKPIDAPAWVRRALGTGWVGVHLFFVLSGFLVGGLAFSEICRDSGIHVPRFWLRRFFRTWPLYYTLLFYVVWRGHNLSPPLLNWVTFTQNFYPLTDYVQTWTLAIEEQFYFVLPVALAFLVRARLYGYVLVFIMCGIVASTVFRAFSANGGHTMFVLDSLLVGVGIAYLHRQYPMVLQSLSRRPNATFMVGLACVYLPLLCLSPSTPVGRVLTGSGLAFGFGLVVIAALEGKLVISRPLRCSVAYCVALASYSVYLSHALPIRLTITLSKQLGFRGSARTSFLLCVGALASTCVGLVLYFLIERPWMKTREVLVPARGGLITRERGLCRAGQSPTLLSK